MTAPGDTPPSLPPPIRRLFHGGLIAFPAVAALFMFVGEIGLGDALMLAFLVELLPVLAVVQLPLAESVEMERGEMYRGSAIASAVLAGLALLLGVRRAGWEGVGLGRPPELGDLVWGAAVAMTILMVLLAWAQWRRRAGREEEELVGRLLPRTTGERWGFLGLSLCAGLFEEIVFRGYAMGVVTLATGEIWMAVAVTSGAFGLVHVYQGGIGIARTGFIGLILALTFVASGSLWPAIIAHALADIGAGLWLADRLLA